MTSGCRGTPYFRRHDRELVLKPAISLKKSWGGYRSKNPNVGSEKQRHRDVRRKVVRLNKATMDCCVPNIVCFVWRIAVWLSDSARDLPLSSFRDGDACPAQACVHALHISLI